MDHGHIFSSYALLVAYFGVIIASLAVHDNWHIFPNVPMT
jgi:hypothetical protein